MMYNWTNDFEKNKTEFEKLIYKYEDKLIKLKNPKEIINYKINNN